MSSTGYVLPEAPLDAWVHGNGQDVPLLIGKYNNSEIVDRFLPVFNPFYLFISFIYMFISQILGHLIFLRHLSKTMPL